MMSNSLDQIDKQRFSAIVRQVWNLTTEEKQELNHYFLLTSSAEELLLNVDKMEEDLKQAPRISLRHNGRILSCHFLKLTFDELVEEPELPLLISCRIHYPSNTWCALVRKSEPRLYSDQPAHKLNTVYVKDKVSSSHE